LEGVGPVVGVLGHGAVDPGAKVAPDRRARVLVQRQRRRGVADEHVCDPDLEALELGDRTHDLFGHEVEAARPRLEPQLPLDPGQPDSRRTIAATDATTTAAPATIVAVMCSERIAQPRKIAMTGFTYAYVATFEIGACWSTHTYAVKATSEPIAIR